jgi:hypothetical protein
MLQSIQSERKELLERWDAERHGRGVVGADEGGAVGAGLSPRSTSPGGGMFSGLSLRPASPGGGGGGGGASNTTMRQMMKQLSMQHDEQILHTTGFQDKVLHNR